MARGVPFLASVAIIVLSWANQSYEDADDETWWSRPAASWKITCLVPFEACDAASDVPTVMLGVGELELVMVSDIGSEQGKGKTLTADSLCHIER